MAENTPILKRKGEEGTPQRKSKKQRKSEAPAVQDEKAQAAPIATSTPKKSKSTSTTLANGISDVAPVSAITASPSKAGSKSQQKGDAAHQPQAAKAAKKKEKKDKNLGNNPESKEAVRSEIAGASGLQVSAPTKSKKHKSRSSAKWNLSQAQGGWFLPTDPVFSPDEKYLILANSKSLQVYATETSLLANSLPIGGSATLTAYALSSTKPNQAYVADSNGLVTLWDWVNSTKIGRWEIGDTVRNMIVITQPESKEDFVYCHEAGTSHVINVHALRTKSQTSKTDLKRVLKTSAAIRGLQVLHQGKYIIVATADSIMVGKRLKPTRTALQDFEYVWREFKFSKRITTFSAYIREPEDTGKGKKAAQDQRDILDIAVGEETGVIYLFENILATFAAVEKSQKDKKERADNAENLRPKRLHWHRDAVGSVKWSLDGNYIISGGDETVLTIWQISTGKQQHLPHLSAAIENVVVAPSGSSYALTLANNSVIVLSTTELEAKTNIVGIQSRRIDVEQLPKETKSGKAFFDIFHPVPMAINSINSDEVLLAVPSSQPRQKNEGLRPEPYLQTFDLANHRAKSRQALTRNTATEPNVAPEGGRIAEPSVKLLKVSHDGEWLATIDEWVPPRADSGFLNEGIPEFNEEERQNRREVYLKIWRRDEENAQWRLDTRIDAPHFFDDVCGNGRVFDLVVDPSALGFATVGEDHVVRVWRPKTRTRDGVAVRGVTDEGLVTWSLDRTVELSDRLDVLEGSQQALPPRNAKLAFSTDGSVLAAAVSWAADSDFGVTHLVDVEAAVIRRSITEVDVTALSGLGFVGQHLVIVADSLTVWNMVLDQLTYSIVINTPGIDQYERSPLVRLAIDEANGTFAVALPQFESYDIAYSGSRVKKAMSKISIYNTDQKDAIWSNTIPCITLALAARQGEPGYIILDSTSCIKAINPASVPLQLPTPPPEEKAELQRTVYTQEEDEEDHIDGSLASLTVTDDLTQDLAEDTLHFTTQRLQEVLDTGLAPPPPHELFSVVLALISRPTKVVAL
ncbi:NET1-associated nuclear protein 1 [Coniothyrium glycines]